MYEEFYGFTEKPFKITPNPDYLYMSPKHKNALTILRYGLTENVGFILLTGEIGAGKTTLINYILKQIESDMEVAVLFNTNVNSEELLEMILRAFELEPVEGSKTQTLEVLNKFLIDQYANHRRSLLIIDEAQNLSKEALEEVRILSNLQSSDQILLQIMLVGQPELKMRLKDPGFVQFAQRIAVNYHLEALTHIETIAYIYHRLGKAGGKLKLFSAEAIDLIFKSSGGVPRTINLLCDSALVYGYADEVKTIGAGIINNVIKELGFMGMYSPPPPTPDQNAPEANTSTVNGLAQHLQGIENGLLNIASILEAQSGLIETKIENFKGELVEELKDMIPGQQNSNDEQLAQNDKAKEKKKVTNIRSTRKKKSTATQTAKTKSKTTKEPVSNERAESKKPDRAAKSGRMGSRRNINDILDL